MEKRTLGILLGILIIVDIILLLLRNNLMITHDIYQLGVLFVFLVFFSIWLVDYFLNRSNQNE